jgi:hypothetical protein
MLGLMAIGRWFMQLAPVVRIGAWLQSLTRRAVLEAHPLSLAATQAVEEIQRTQGASLDGALRKMVNLIGWLGEHRQQVVALVELVAVAVQEAEFFSELSGPEKKTYARYLVIAFLEDVGLIESETSLLYFVIERFLDWLIDAVVSIFNKRAESFGHRRAPVGVSSARRVAVSQ